MNADPNIPNPRLPIPVQFTREGFRKISSDQGAALIQVHPAKPPPPPCVVIEIPDRDRAREVNPLLLSGDITPLWHALAGPAVVRVDNVDVFRVTPTTAGTAPTRHLDADTFALILDALGVDDDGSATTETWAQQGLAAAVEAMRHAPPDEGLHRFQRSRSVAEAQAVAVARCYGAPVEGIAKLLGRPVTLGKTLLPPLARAKELDAMVARQKTEGDAADAKLMAERVEAARVNTDTLDTLGCQAVLVPLLDAPGVQVPKELAGLPSFTSDGGAAAVFPWRAIPGLSLGPIEFAGVRVLAGDFVINAPARTMTSIPMATVAVYSLVCALIRKYAPGDFGPITAFSKDGIDAARAFISQWASYLYDVRMGREWLPRHLVEMSVRAYRLRPDVAVAEWSAALQGIHSGAPVPRVPASMVPIGTSDREQAFRNPGLADPPDGIRTLVQSASKLPWPQRAVQRSQLETWAVEATQGGIVESGSGLGTTNTVEGKRSNNGIR
jgi:hypothetical protein